MLEAIRVCGMLLGIGWGLVLLWFGFTMARAALAPDQVDDEETLAVRQAREIVERVAR